MKRNKEFIVRRIAGETVLVPAGENGDFNGMVTLSDVGAFIWEHLETAGSFQELVDMVLAEYEVDRQTAAHDVSDFLNQLLQTQMAVFSDPDRQW